MVYNMKINAFTELSFIDILQMLGRAGRPQFDRHGTGIIITNHSNLHFYLSVLNEQLPIESQLIKALPDILNAEIVNGNIWTFEDAFEWLKLTYLNIRMFQNPSLYGVQDIDPGVDTLNTTIRETQKDLVHSALLL